MKYEGMSDFEINKLVSEHVDFGELIVSFNESSETIYLLDKDGAFEMLPISYFDPCNNPIDAWPIIVESDITVRGGGIAFIERSFIDVPAYVVRNKNALRAAMICFLKMKGAESRNESRN